MRIRFSTAILLAVLLCTFCAWAQTPTGAIEGDVTDQTGAVIPNAKVTVTESATKRTINLTATSEGRYAVRNLLPGIYSIRADAPGFAAKLVENIAVSSGSVVNGNITLEVGKTGEVIAVTAEAVMVDTTRQTVDSVVTSKDFQALPYFSRNFLDLAALAPGTFIRDGGDIDPTKTFAYRTVGVAGRSGTATRVQVDGIDVTDETVGTTTANFSPESVSEFQLTRSSLDPSTSLTSSGSINIISKNGGNEIHGGWFWDYYNQDMGARLQYNDAAVPFKRNRTGGSVGGPFIKDKLFWFASWERHYQTEQAVNRVPEFPQLNISQGFPVGIRYADGRMDWNATPSTRVFAKFHHDWNLSTGGSAVSPFQNIDWTNTVTVGFDVAKARQTHTYRFGYVNFNNRIESQELDYKFLRTPNGIPFNLTVGPYDAAGPNGLAPQATYQDNWQNSYEGSYFLGKHTVRFGFDIRRVILGGFANFAGPLTVTGTYDDATIEALKARGADIQEPLNYPLEYFSMGPANGFFNLAPAHGLPHGGHFITRPSWFVQDSIKVTRRFTMNLGLRWQYDTGYFASKDIKREPMMERWGKGFSAMPEVPKTLFSPSFGFAWDPRGNAKTVIRGGFYKGYEMNILNNTMFDEFAMLPNGLGPDLYEIYGVSQPDGTPINVDGNHPTGDYSDMIGMPLKDAMGTLGQLQAALSTAYSTYQFDPNKGESAFVSSGGLFYGAAIPGNQFKIPYALQFNLGVQRELTAGTVLSVDYIYNHGIGLPIQRKDYEMRRDASTLNVANAQAKINKVLGGMTMDEWIAANPDKNISSFGLVSDSIFRGLYPDMTRARFMAGGFTKYRGLQVSLRGGRSSLWKLRDLGYNVAYALARNETSGTVSRVEFIATANNNRDINHPRWFGPNNLDHTHMLRWAVEMTVPEADHGVGKYLGGFRLGSFWSFVTAGAQSISVPNLGGAISGPNLVFGVDLNGDNNPGDAIEPLPGMNAGQFGRAVKSFGDLNKLIQQFNSTQAGQLTPHGQALVAAGLFTEAQLKALGAVSPTIPLVPEGNPNPWHNNFVADLRFGRPIKLGRWSERMEIIPAVDFYNLFNHAPADLYSGLGGVFGALNFDYAGAGPGEGVSDLTYKRGRITTTRKVMIGIRFNF